MLKRHHLRYLLPAVAGLGIAVLATAGFADQMAGPGDGPRRGLPRFLEQMDTNHDGKVTQAEITAFEAARTAEIDTNKDGKITPEEVQAYREKLRQQRMAERFARMDTNGDGVVSVQEYEAAQTWRLARLDRDGDGVIEGNEMGGHGPMHRHHQRHWQDGDGIE
jgi:EF hand domain-containing protein